MKFLHQHCLSSFLITLFFLHCEGRLEATKIENGKVYQLESQHDGAFLTAFGEGKVGTSQANGDSSPNRQWTFQQNAFTNYLCMPGYVNLTKLTELLVNPTGDSSWTLTPVINDINVVSEQTWKITYVGHGKSQFQSLSTGKCLLNSRSGANVLDGNCDKQDPRQRWRVY
ncbi:hypothetical protein Ocin01_05777 [Orchesella cincta]|uniref:Ricin B lectin domain-containing protein n=1 Tax=Orchesella cincta TaxID=48709 RepID=A0A1D2N7H9_ORCCI|nr:hypothetical protein Ocin01_05777 [Orchesella cincta]